jgi:hypothetical protein
MEAADRVAPETEFYQHDFRVSYYKKSAKKGLFEDDTVRGDIRRARVCLGCGYVLFFVKAEDLKALAAHEGDLELKPE